MNHLASLNKYFFKYRGLLLLGILFIICTNVFAVYTPQIIRFAVDEITDQIGYYTFFSGTSLQTEFLKLFGWSVLFFGIMVVLLAVMRGVFLFFMRQTIIVMSRHIEFDQKNALYDHYQKLDLNFYKTHSTGDMMSRISEDVGRVRMYTGPAVMYTINLFVLFVLVVYTMLRVNVELTIYTVAPLTLLGVSIFIVNGIIERKSEAIQRQLSFLTTVAQESYSGIRIIKSFRQEEMMSRYFNTECENYKMKTLDLARTEAIYFPTIFMLVGLSIVFTIYVGGRQVMAGNITPGNIAEFVIYINMITWPMASVGWVMALVQRAVASQARINEFLNSKPEITSVNNVESSMKGDIEFRNVSFTYPNTGIEALKNISFKIKSGERLAVVGRTGSGKSTIGILASRLYDSTKGEVLIDEKNIREWNLEQLREQTGYVPQDVFLFSDSVANNIAFGKNEGDIRFEEIKQAAVFASVDRDIQQLHKQYETVVGERGVTLSGGQKQRISIGRALLKNPALLIFDDCLSAVDAHTEQEILNYMNEVLKDRTAIIITHRIFSLLNFDKIIVLDNGKIIEEGIHESLLQRRGAYFELYESQQLQEKVAAIS